MDKRILYLLVLIIFLAFIYSATEISPDYRNNKSWRTYLPFIIPVIFSLPYVAYALGLFSLKKRGRVSFFYSIFLIFIIVYLIMDKVLDRSPFLGGLCSEGRWCWIYGQLFILPIAFIIFIIGLIRMFMVRHSQEP